MGPWSEAKVVLKNPTSYFTGLPSNDKNNNLEDNDQIDINNDDE